MPEDSKKSKIYTADDVKNHNKKDDIWFIVHGKVYNLTKYLDEHPGGVEIMEENAGKDVSDQFEEFFHSTDAREILKKHEVGVLEGATEEDWKKLDEGGSGGSTSSAGSASLGTPLFIIVLAVVFYFLNKQYNWV
mmetsp:Transcript_19309/g.26972  ORF Transcript_19309/g.26972 Transcript_19309/m.26972 type:complete len:135 (+) Transcript_19309:124-528(+)|eukprot:CAMPEP_0184486766 /NCGR_PEP_ID=MMETSP0113_2-20130426/8572_1 /TAXON_ID=91329 /ORGANISM="Norrisiella sphaerica, Strain BC52" /LENGTH=134 /DNA_ID=CAMNT_0026868797 /DNA_START=93 /DNA_END=497 /DNA_ORIENTATION=-